MWKFNEAVLNTRLTDSYCLSTGSGNSDVRFGVRLVCFCPRVGKIIACAKSERSLYGMPNVKNRLKSKISRHGILIQYLCHI